MEELNICEDEDHNWEVYETSIDWFWTEEQEIKDFILFNVRCTKCRTRGRAKPFNKKELESVSQIVDVTVPFLDNDRVKLDRGWSDAQAHIESLKIKYARKNAPLESSTRLQELLESQPN